MIITIDSRMGCFINLEIELVISRIKDAVTSYQNQTNDSTGLTNNGRDILPCDGTFLPPKIKR